MSYNEIIVRSYSGGTSEIIKTSNAPHGLKVISSFRDQAGNFVSPPADTLAIYTTAGEKLCFDYKTNKQAAPEMGITILLDRSGSMGGNMEAVTAIEQVELLCSWLESEYWSAIKK